MAIVTVSREKKITFSSFSWHLTCMGQNNPEVLICHLKTSSIGRHVISFWKLEIMYCQMYINTDHQSDFFKITMHKIERWYFYSNRRVHIHTDLSQNSKQCTIKQINNFNMNKACKVLYFYEEMVIKSVNEIFLGEKWMFIGSITR